MMENERHQQLVKSALTLHGEVRESAPDVVGRGRMRRLRGRRGREDGCERAARGWGPQLGLCGAAAAYDVTSWAIAVAQPLYVTRCCRCPGGSGPSPSSRSRPPSCSASAGSSSHGGLDTLARRSLHSVSRRRHGGAGAVTHHPSRCHRRRAPHGPGAERRRPPCSALELSRPRRQIRRRHGLQRRFLAREALSRSAKLPRPSPRLSRAGVTSLLPDSVAARETEELAAGQIRRHHHDSGRFLWHRAPLRPRRATPPVVPARRPWSSSPPDLPRAPPPAHGARLLRRAPGRGHPPRGGLAPCAA
ncbi:hypothetical protein PVAP13_5KG481907 [Panicum virgatum]|uniref:Uncharacterized protein n=1 Tax=Panicum virgatum TaxID=38727 RepID=A0A8T0SS20_PANVG|nr:hypothetical protein PVAP13_5KG481907 [Panicum virgatum]